MPVTFLEVKEGSAAAQFDGNLAFANPPADRSTVDLKNI